MTEKKKEVKKEEKVKKAETKQKKVKTEKKVKIREKAEKKIPEGKKKIPIKSESEKKTEKKVEVKKTKTPALRKEVKKKIVPKKEEVKKVYRIKGSFLMGNRYQVFTKEVLSSDPKEKIYSDFGSRHKVKRGNIKIDDVKELKNDEITDPLLKQLAKGE